MAARAESERSRLAEEEKAKKLAAVTGQRGTQALTSNGFAGFGTQATMGDGMNFTGA
jgi:hypothetical protein